MVTSTILAFITQYSILSSCHNKNKAGECLMASGKVVYEGAVACSRSIKLKTRVEIDGKQYTCDDRYSRSLDKKRGLPTFDIYTTSSVKEIKKFGLKKRNVIIYERK